MVLLVLAFGAVGSAQAAGPSLTCTGGCITAQNPTVFTVLWEPSNWTAFPWNKLGYDVADVQSFIPNLNETSYSNLLAQYSPSANVRMDQIHYGGSCTITDSTNDPNNGGNLAGTTGFPISDATMFSKIQECLNSNPSWSSSSNPIIMMYPAEGLFFNGPGALATKKSNVDFCGYHSQHNGVTYAEIASPAATLTCVPAPTYEGDAIWLTDHELYEAITDPGVNGNGWSDQNAGPTQGFEIADECNSDNNGITSKPGQNVNLNGTTYLLPGMWSNLTGSCQWASFQGQASPIITGTQGANGWYTSNVTLNWDIQPSQSNERQVTGCVPQSVTTDQDTTFPCTVQGLNFLTQTAWGPAFNGATEIKRDSTAPVFSGTTVPGSPFLFGDALSPLPGANDPTSGLDPTKSICPITTATVGTRSVGCTATNMAGEVSVGTQSYKVIKVTANLAKDGGFETPKETAARTTFTAGAAIGPWKVQSGGPVEIGRAAAWKAAAGAQSLDLETGRVNQTFKLTATGNYAVTFKNAGVPACTPAAGRCSCSQPRQVGRRRSRPQP